ncbi:MAG: OmpA family protein [Planctomycetota bacterium]
MAGLACVVGSGFGCQAVNTSRQLEYYQKENQTLMGDRNRLEGELATCEGERTALTREISGFSQALSEAREENFLLRNAGMSEESADLTFAMEPGEETGFEGIEGLQVERRSDGEIHITLEHSVLFTPGSANITRSGHKALEQIAATLKSRFAGRTLRVEGHTDHAPTIKSRNRYPTNWELSSARASAVLVTLIEASSVDPLRCYVAGYADQRPVAGNDTEEGRRANRRVEVVILPQ